MMCIYQFYSLSADVIMSLTYGYDIAESNNKFVIQADDIVQRAVSALLPGTTMMNLLPFCVFICNE